MTAHAACRGIREHDTTGSIGVVGAEEVPALQAAAAHEGALEGRRRGARSGSGRPTSASSYVSGRTHRLARPRRAAPPRTTAASRTATSACCSRPADGRGRSPPGATTSSTSAPSPTTARSARRPPRASRFIVIGGGFIGSEIAAALRTNGCEVTLRRSRSPASARASFPPTSRRSSPTTTASKGVEVLADETVASVEGTRRHDRRRPRARGGLRRRRDSGSSRPPSSRPTPGSRSTTASSWTSSAACGGRDDVFAAGDVARFPASALGVTMRVEHEDNANSHGRAVGANMAGADEPYDHLPFFYSDLFELGYEAVGEVDSRHETVAEWESRTARASSAYVDDEGRPRGFLLWDVWGTRRRRHRPDRGGRADHVRDAARPAGLSRAATPRGGRRRLGQAVSGRGGLRRPGRR